MRHRDLLVFFFFFFFFFWPRAFVAEILERLQVLISSDPPKENITDVLTKVCEQHGNVQASLFASLLLLAITGFLFCFLNSRASFPSCVCVFGCGQGDFAGDEDKGMAQPVPLDALLKQYEFPEANLS